MQYTEPYDLPPSTPPSLNLPSLSSRSMQDLKQPTPAPLPGHLRVSRYEASGAHFPHRLVASIDDSPSSEIMHDAA
eukprot:497801-Rhodomonas_salina.1